MLTVTKQWEKKKRNVNRSVVRNKIRACLHGGGGPSPQVGEVTRISVGGVTRLSVQSLIFLNVITFAC